MINQLFLNGVIAGSVYVLTAISFAIIYRTVKFFHFAHGILFTLGAYFTYTIKVCLNFPPLLAMLVAIGLCAGFGMIIELAVYRPLRHKGSSALISLLASLGLYIAIQNIISIFFGDAAKSIRWGTLEGGIEFIGARITNIQICIIATSIVLLMIVLLLDSKTKIGRAVRAISGDQELARVSGINSDLIILLIYGIGSGIAGLAGILIALDVDMTPTMGLNMLMMGVVAVVIGGKKRLLGVALGGVLLGISEHLGVWKINTQWQDTIAFIILFVFLIIKPKGFIGKKI